jgi:hypothetical protein
LDLIDSRLAELQNQIDQFRKEASPERKFINVTVNLDGGLTNDGAPTSWHELDQRLDNMPESQRKRTVLALSAASPNLPVGLYFMAQFEASRLVQNHQLAYLSNAGIKTSQKPFPAALPENLNHQVPFKIGKTYFVGGDNLTIEQIRGSSDHVGAGNTYEITGSYHLASEDQALLAVYVTSWDRNPPGQQDCVPIKINKGNGQFTMKFHMWVDGSPHVSMYLRGDSSDCVYFGTEPSQLN